jgi:prevent-host-death family protein
MNGHTIVVMTDGSGRAVKRRSRRARPRGQLSAAEFKATCLELMDRVRETGVEYVVTKHGKPVAKLVPYTDPERKPLFGSMKGTVLKYERPLDPIEADYDINRD